MIKVGDLPLDVNTLSREEALDDTQLKGALPEVVATLERKEIRMALDENDRAKARAAKSPGISERVLAYKMDKYNMAKRQEERRKKCRLHTTMLSTP